MTIHCHNWKSANLVTDKGVKTVCHLRRPLEAIAPLPFNITCGVCALRVVREGQARGLVVELIATWSWNDLGAPEPSYIDDPTQLHSPAPEGVVRAASETSES